MPRGTSDRAERARDLLEYNRAVFDRFVRRLSRLPWKEVSRNREIGHLSLFKTLVHILNVQEVWLEYAVPGRQSEMKALFEREDRHPTSWKAFRAYSDRVWKGAQTVVGQLSDRDLERRVKVPWFAGRYTVYDALLQTTIEQAHHLGEVIGALWQDDLASPDMTWLDLRLTPGKGRSRR